jgi:hypothetical protein
MLARLDELGDVVHELGHNPLPDLDRLVLELTEPRVSFSWNNSTHSIVALSS